MLTSLIIAKITVDVSKNVKLVANKLAKKVRGKSLKLSINSYFKITL